MKGFSNILVWMILGAILMITSVYIISNYYSKIEENARINKGIDSFYLLRTAIEETCNSFPGETRFITLIYPAEFDYIYGENYKVCYSYKNIRECKDLTCKINYFNITIHDPNSPYKEALNNNIVEFLVEVKKVGVDEVKVNFKLKI